MCTEDGFGTVGLAKMGKSNLFEGQFDGQAELHGHVGDEIKAKSRSYGHQGTLRMTYCAIR